MKKELETIDEKHLEIIQGALKIFMTLGIKSVTMDDVASNLGISKKTLYKYVKDKSDLLIQSVKGFQVHEYNLILEVIDRKLNAIDESYEISKIVMNHISDIHPSVMFDMQRHYPGAMRLFEEYKSETVYNWLLENMERGMKEGYFRNNLNTEIIAKFYLSHMDQCFNQEMFPRAKFSMKDIYLEMFRYHIRGIASEKGVEFLREKIKKEKQQS
ncbi:MAG TPA: hypothetical protein DCS15_02355 [Flavobacteriales bacterium]|jgi:AcrR family transcriptional regulator|nr:TetR/AcrR family transcriptional regulator [Salibacteraceae bacterium]HAS35303.1 hypothetical protein [Flavobacteriales bacterium]